MKNETEAALALVAKKIDEALTALDMPLRVANEYAEIARAAAVANHADDASQVAHAKADARRHRLLAIADYLRDAKNGAIGGAR